MKIKTIISSWLHRVHLGQITVWFMLLTCTCMNVFAQRADEYKNLTGDGSWCWFSDPRAIYLDGEHQRTYVGFVTSEGNVMIMAQDHETDETFTKVLYEKLMVDDHVNPSLLVLPDNRLMVFFTRHNGTIYYTTSKEAENIMTFEPLDSLDFGKMLCYTNPIMLSEENNRIYVFFRGGYDWKPSYIFTDDFGTNWSQPKSIVSKKINVANNRPYTKVVSDGKASIHFAFTDGHPREENHNSIYHIEYRKGKFYDVSGNEVGDTSNLPMVQENLPKVYDGVKNNRRAWIWDIALGEDNDPVMVYTTLPEETQHFYHYAIWTGSEWRDTQICRAGSAFPRFNRAKENRDPEPHYSGGIVLDHDNPNRVYLSRPHNDHFEIEEWTTLDKGKSFMSKSLTSQSLRDNVRPFVVRNAPEDINPRVLWMNINYYKHYTNYHTVIKGNKKSATFSDDLSQQSIYQVMSAVADWQIDNFTQVKHHPLDWTNGALYTGMMAWSKMAKDAKYTNWLEAIGNRFGWQPFYRIYHADDVVVSQMYLDMYKMKKSDPRRYRYLGPTQARLDYVMSHPSQGTLLLDYSDPKTLERWSWCDALFMAPPVYVKMAAITGEEQYLAFMDKEFKATYNFLYDQQAHLFYRDYRYFPHKKLENNGEKIFWGRGNGWVMGGLVAILKDLPRNSSYRPFYEQLFREMAEKVIACQDDQGFWHPSMLDHDTYPNPETSSSGFFCYALAYGVNAGLLDRDAYYPAVVKAWRALVSAVDGGGKLGWVQPIGQDPKSVTDDMTEVYGVGAFLLAGSEVSKLNSE